MRSDEAKRTWYFSNIRCRQISSGVLSHCIPGELAPHLYACFSNGRVSDLRAVHSTFRCCLFDACRSFAFGLAQVDFEEFKDGYFLCDTTEPAQPVTTMGEPRRTQVTNQADSDGTGGRPAKEPAGQPAHRPSRRAERTSQPTRQPDMQPTNQPTIPTSQPASQPASQASDRSTSL